MKDAGMRIRVEPELRDQFINLCRDNDVPAAQVLRSFMREYIHTSTIAKTHSKSLVQTLAKKSAANGRLVTAIKRT